MPFKIYPIAGVKYRGPAKAILTVLPTGSELELWAEPSNPADPNAIMVVLTKGKQVPLNDKVDSILASYNLSREELVANEWHLGYIPALAAAKLKTEYDWSDRICSFLVGPRGGCQVQFEIEEIEPQNA